MKRFSPMFEQSQASESITGPKAIIHNARGISIQKSK
jgi:hypothetical protein